MSSKSCQCRHPIAGDPEEKAKKRRRRKALRGGGRRHETNPIKQSLRNEIAARQAHNAKLPRHFHAKTSVKKIKPDIEKLYQEHGKVAVAP